MVIVGYDDKKGGFRLANSWGTDWAGPDSGFTWFSYSLFDQALPDVAEAYLVYSHLQPAATQTMLVAVANRQLVPSGTMSTQRSTADHCQANTDCNDRNLKGTYSLSVSAGDQQLLKSPKLECVSGPCDSAIVTSVSLAGDNRQVVASWEAWGHPTTWRLVADQVSIQTVSTTLQRVVAGEALSVATKKGDPDPLLTVLGAPTWTKPFDPAVGVTDTKAVGILPSSKDVGGFDQVMLYRIPKKPTGT